MTTDTGKPRTTAEASSWLNARAESYRHDARAFDTMTDLQHSDVWAACYRAIAQELSEAGRSLASSKEG